MKRVVEGRVVVSHMLFCGPAGVGKSGVVRAFLRDFLGYGWSDRCVVVNGYDVRGIDSVRRLFRGLLGEDELDGLEGFPGVGEPSVRFVLIECIDSLVEDAQFLLAYYMEFLGSTIVLATAGDVSGLIPLLLSRFMVFRLPRLRIEDIMEILSRVSESEGLDVGEEVLFFIARASGGDARKAINILQYLSMVGDFSQERVEEAAGLLTDFDVRVLADLALSGRFEKPIRKLRELLARSYSGLEIVRFMFDYVREKGLDPRLKVELFKVFADTEVRLREGCDECLQLSGMVSRVCDLVGAEEMFNS